MGFRLGALVLVPFLVLAVVSETFGAVEWTPGKTFKIEKAPIDVAFSPDGRWVFVLTDGGNLLIYSAEGKLAERIAVGTHVDGIQAGQKADTLFLISKKNRTVEEIVLDFIQHIDISGSPFKGKGTAPVVIAVFNDYQ